MTKVRYVEARYDTTISWDIEDIAERNNFKIEEIDKIEVGKWVKIFITLKDGTIFQEDGGTGDSTDWKWAEHQSFYDKDWLSIDEEEING
tara:strand:- start:982 stop:1251 length:270 start_codon:yes stop_codon:yes gene_type:complete